MEISLMIQQWHEEGMKLSARYKSDEARMTELLSLIAQNRAYHLYKCDSLKAYALYMWLLPESAAADMVTVANKSLEVPELIAALKRGRATVSKLRKICSVITRDNAAAWIELAEECTTAVIQKAVAMEKPDSEMQSQMHYKSETIVSLQADIPEELKEKLERLTDLLSTKRKRSLKIHEVLEYLADLGLHRLDPIQRAERQQARKEKDRVRQEQEQKPRQELEKVPVNLTKGSENADQAVPQMAKDMSSLKPKDVENRISKFKKRERIKADIQHQIQLRDRGQCTHIKLDGSRCSNRRWLQTHHRKPVALGGTNELENLVTACSGHHAMYHHH